MAKEKEPHKQITEENNNLTSAQEVLYQKDFNKADGVIRNKQQNNNNK